MSRARKDVKLLTDLSGRPTIVIGNHDVCRGSVCAEQSKWQSERTHSDEWTRGRGVPVGAAGAGEGRQDLGPDRLFIAAAARLLRIADGQDHMH